MSGRLSTLDTVATDTPARAATSLIPTGGFTSTPPVRGGQAHVRLTTPPRKRTRPAPPMVQHVLTGPDGGGRSRAAEPALRGGARRATAPGLAPPHLLRPAG